MGTSYLKKPKRFASTIAIAAYHFNSMTPAKMEGKQANFPSGRDRGSIPLVLFNGPEADTVLVICASSSLPL